MTREEELRKPDAKGKPVTLSDGNTWIIPSLRVDRKSIEIARLLDAKGSLGDIMDAFYRWGLAILRKNYPGLTEEDADGLFDFDTIPAMIEAATAGLAQGNVAGPQG